MIGESGDLSLAPNGVLVSDCRVCASPNLSLIDRENIGGDTYNIVRCKRCSLVYIRETRADVSPEYTSFTADSLDSEQIRLQTSHKHRAFSQCLDLVRDQWLGEIRAGATLLDVGCGIGGWLDKAQASFECYGFDASVAQSEYAKRRHPNVRNCTTIEEYERTLPSIPEFDLITMWDVLEHIRKPVGLLRALGSHLSHSGLIFASVPSANPMVLKSRLARHSGRRKSFTWNPREHVSYYSPRTLNDLLKRCGFEVLSIGSVVVYPRPWSAYEVVRRIAFAATNLFPVLSPQIYVLARPQKTSTISTKRDLI